MSKRLILKIPRVNYNYIGYDKPVMIGEIGSLIYENIDSSELLFKLDEYGICASGGSACSSGDNNPSHVLTAIGVPSELAKGAIRFTFGDFNTQEDIDYLVEVLRKII